MVSSNEKTCKFHIKLNDIFMWKIFCRGHLKQSRQLYFTNFPSGPNQGGAFRRHWFWLTLTYTSLVSPKWKLEDVNNRQNVELPLAPSLSMLQEQKFKIAFFVEFLSYNHLWDGLKCSFNIKVELWGNGTNFFCFFYKFYEKVLWCLTNSFGTSGENNENVLV